MPSFLKSVPLGERALNERSAPDFAPLHPGYALKPYLRVEV